MSESPVKSDVSSGNNGTEGGCSVPGQNPEEKLLLAAAYVYDAQYNRNIPFETSPEAIRLYYFYNHWVMQVLTYVCITVDLALAIFEEPAVYHLPFLATSIVEVFCLLAFFGRLVHFSKVTPRSVFWKDTKNICVMVTIFLNLIDLIIYGSLLIAQIPSVRWSRILRPIYLVNFAESRQIRRAFRSIRNTLPEILYVFLLFMFSVLIFSLMAQKLFGSRKLVTAEGEPYFENYLDGVFNLYVLVTTANSPDVMMPAYDYSWWYSVFFIAYIILNTYIFMSVFLAVVYNNYRKHLKNEIRKLAYMKRRKMADAFNALKEQEGSEFVISESTWLKLVKLVAPDISNSHRELLLRVSKEDNQRYVGKEAFIRLADLLNIRVITMKARMHPFECWMPHLYRSAASRFIRRVVLHKGFIYAFDVVILVNAIFIGLEDKIPLISNAEWVFLSLYVIEILLKLYTYDPRSFFAKSQFWNWFDTFIIIAALIGTTVNTAMKSVSLYDSQDILDIVFILRVLRLIRIIDSFQRFRVIMNTLLNIFPTMLTFCGIILTIYYVFAIIGMEVFKNKIRFFPENSTDPYAQDCGAEALRGSSFAKSKYCKNNFNDLSSAFVVLVELTVVNQWHVLATGFALVTHPTAKLYFITFHVVVVIMIINIFVAFILEAFFVEYSLEKSEVETTIEKKIQELGMAVQEEDIPTRNLVDNMDNGENDLGGFDEENKKGLMFQIASKRYRTVDALLQRMFEAEIPPEDEGPPMEDIMNLSSNDLYIENPTFNSAA
ncbi:two pore calcium channel protein 1-like isoform X1 [Dendrobates tinctorius]|uniref:two pore calcium channel protein 1-like isoform X1 n=2 Tax=Dendrobates tinctorius TaxID=92724 RepID=UPI003CC9A691